MKKIFLIMLFLLFGLSIYAERNKIKVGFINEFKPYYEINEKGEMSGFAIEFIKEISKDSYELEFVNCKNWKDAHEKLFSGEIDIIPNMGIADDRIINFLFSIPYEKFNVSMFVLNKKEYKKIKGIEDIKTYKVGVVELNAGKSIAENYELKNIVVYSNYYEMFHNFIEEKIPIIFYPENTIEADLLKFNKRKDFIKIKKPLKKIERAVGFNKERQDLLIEYNKLISSYISSAEYRRLYSKYFNDNIFNEKKIIPLKILISILALVLILVILIILFIGLKIKSNELINEKQEKELLIMNIPDILYKYSVKYGGIYHSKRVYDILGFTQEELKIKPNLWHDSIHKDDLKKVDEEIKKSINGEKFEVEYRIKDKKGEYRWLQDKCILIKKDDDDILIFGMAKDITNEYNYKKELKESEERFKALHNASFGGITIHNKGIILECNQGLSEITGYSYDELIGMNGLLLIDESTREFVIEKINSGYEKPYEAVGIRKNGEKYPVRLEARNIKYKGNQVRVVEFRDITEIKITENELIISKEIAEKASKAKSEFLSNMSHELRTPMNGINGFLELLLDIEKNDEKKGYLNIIKESSEHLMEIINDILSISKIEAGKFKIKEQESNLYIRFNSIAKIFKIQCEIKGLEFKLEVDKSLQKNIISDEHTILKILNNLLSNAVKFTEKGYVGLSAKEIEGKKIEIIVKDTGIGINEEKQKHLFEPFEQGEHYLTKQYGGTGLGLAIVKKMLELLNGEIFVNTAIEKGTEWKIIIPYKEILSQPMKEGIKKDLTIKEKLKIISAEDVEINQILLEKIIKSEDNVFKKVYNGKELLEALEEEDYNLVLMDIQMPILNGIEATKLIRQHEKHKHIPIIGLSAYAFEENIEKMYEVGINDYISKPIKKEELISKINKWAKTKNV